MSQGIILDLIDPDPDQPRKQFDVAKLEELAQSMKEKGLIVPIMVRPSNDRYIMVHGERRYKAALSLGWETIPAEVRDISPEEARWLSLIENVQRQDLSPIEEARAYKERLAEGITQEELGQRIGKGQSYIATKLRFLKLPGIAQSALERGLITEGHAKQLLRIEDTDYLLKLYRRVITDDLTVKSLKSEADKVAEFLKARRLSNLEYVDDKDLLIGWGCEIPWTDVWYAEDFGLCADRYSGIFARFMYLYSSQHAKVCGLGFSNSANVSLDLTLRHMRRKRGHISEADLIFVHFPVGHEPIPLAQRIAMEVQEHAVVVCRTGTEKVDGPGNREMIFAWKALKDFGFNFHLHVVCTLATHAELEHYSEYPSEDGVSAEDGVISCFEEWVSASMSRDILASWITIVTP